MTISVPLARGPRRGLPPTHFADLTIPEVKDKMRELGLPAYRANQIARHYYGRYEADPLQMTDLPASVREAVKDALFPQLLSPVRYIEADGGATQKTLWKSPDGTVLESVLMRYSDRATLCISSQAGCAQACPFCATGQLGIQRKKTGDFCISI